MDSGNLKKIQLLLSKIPKRKVTTYKELARAMGTKGYRYIGNLLHENPEPDKYPCYKVVKSDGTVGGYAKGKKMKIRLLRNDEIEIKKNTVLNLQSVLFKFFA